MKVFVFGVCLFFLPLASLFGQFAGHRVMPYATASDAFAAVNGDTRSVTQAYYTAGFGTFCSFLKVDQPLFQDVCDVLGVGGQVPPPFVRIGDCFYFRHEPRFAGPFDTALLAAAYAAINLNVVERADASIVPMTGKYWLMYPSLGVACI